MSLHVDGSVMDVSQAGAVRVSERGNEADYHIRLWSALPQARLDGALQKTIPLPYVFTPLQC